MVGQVEELIRENAYSIDTAEVGGCMQISRQGGTHQRARVTCDVELAEGENGYIYDQSYWNMAFPLTLCPGWIHGVRRLGS